MNLKSLGYRTDLIFPAVDGEITDRGDYLVIHTPANPTFYYGNYLIFAQPPTPGDVTRWRQLFAAEIGSPPAVRHEVFGWDSPAGEAGDVQPFLDAGFQLSRCAVLSADEVQAPKRAAEGVRVRPLRSDSEWSQALENQILCREDGFTESAYRPFKARQMNRYREMTQRGMGEWFGAYLGDVLVADLGIFHQADLARYQAVETAPDYRRRGIAGKLVYESARYALREFGVHTLVIVASAGSPAERLYRSVGFAYAEDQLALERWPEMEPAVKTD